jgi:hypothetical protein
MGDSKSTYTKAKRRRSGRLANAQEEIDIASDTDAGDVRHHTKSIQTKSPEDDQPAEEEEEGLESDVISLPPSPPKKHKTVLKKTKSAPEVEKERHQLHLLFMYNKATDSQD